MALPLALLILLLISVVGFALIGVGTTEVSVATNWRAYNTAFYAADAGLQHGLVGLRSLFAQRTIPSTLDLNTITPPTLANVKLKDRHLIGRESLRAAVCAVSNDVHHRPLQGHV